MVTNFSSSSAYFADCFSEVPDESGWYFLAIIKYRFFIQDFEVGRLSSRTRSDYLMVEALKTSCCILQSIWDATCLYINCVCDLVTILKQSEYQPISKKRMSSRLKRLREWAYNHSDQSHPKYNTLSHSLTMAIKSTLIFVISSLCIRYYFFPGPRYDLQPAAPYIGVFLELYLLFMITSRYLESGCIALYESLWGCNQCILLAGIGCILGDADLIRTVLIVVSVDQLLWYVDLAGFAWKRKFYVGVAKYIIWPETTKIRLITTTHHVWFLPLCLWIVHPTAKYSSFNVSIYVLACIFCQILVIIGRISTPKLVTLNSGEEDERTIYMNINLSWEVWKDLQIGFLKTIYQMVPKKSLIFVIPLVWDLGNMSGFLIFWAIQTLTR